MFKARAVRALVPINTIQDISFYGCAAGPYPRRKLLLARVELVAVVLESFPGVSTSNPPGPVLAHPVQIELERTKGPERNGPHEVRSRI